MAPYTYIKQSKTFLCLTNSSLWAGNPHPHHYQDTMIYNYSLSHILGGFFCFQHIGIHITIKILWLIMQNNLIFFLFYYFQPISREPTSTSISSSASNNSHNLDQDELMLFRYLLFLRLEEKRKDMAKQQGKQTQVSVRSSPSIFI